MTAIWRAAALAAISLSAACATTAPMNAASRPETAGPVKPAYLAAEIAGKTGDEIDTALGAPDLIRVEGAGEFRRYGLAECALIIVLYPDESGVRRARHLEAGALKSGEAKPDLDRCLARGRAQG
ncbi:MAG: hypothetical protein R3C42_02055 [Parvularculaceae bacterium]|nr:hypothetical protein [Parvularculaceae bacterium]